MFVTLSVSLRTTTLFSYNQPVYLFLYLYTQYTTPIPTPIHFKLPTTPRTRLVKLL